MKAIILFVAANIIVFLVAWGIVSIPLLFIKAKPRDREKLRLLGPRLTMNSEGKVVAFDDTYAQRSFDEKDTPFNVAFWVAVGFLVIGIILSLIPDFGVFSLVTMLCFIISLGMSARDRAKGSYEWVLDAPGLLIYCTPHYRVHIIPHKTILNYKVTYRTDDDSSSTRDYRLHLTYFDEATHQRAKVKLPETGFNMDNFKKAFYKDVAQGKFLSDRKRTRPYNWRLDHFMREAKEIRRALPGYDDINQYGALVPVDIPPNGFDDSAGPGSGSAPEAAPDGGYPGAGPRSGDSYPGVEPDGSAR